MSDDLQILQHSLGVDKYGRGRQYRDYFVTGPESDDFEKCRSLALRDLMFDHGPRTVNGGMHTFTVTKAGREFVAANSPTPPKLSRGQKRYDAFLREDSGLRFGDWLKLRHARG